MLIIKNFLKPLKIFNNNQNKTFTVDEKGVKIEDNELDYYFPQDKTRLIDNPYITDQELKNINIQYIEPDRHIVSNVVSKKIIRHLKVGIRSFGQDKIKIKRVPNSTKNCIFCMIDKLFKKTKKEKHPSEIMVSMPHPFKFDINQNQYFNFPVFPFKFAKDHLYFNCYFNKDQSITTIFSTKFDSLYVNFYTKSELYEGGSDE
jgi:hypothetical protein